MVAMKQPTVPYCSTKMRFTYMPYLLYRTATYAEVSSLNFVEDCGVWVEIHISRCFVWMLTVVHPTEYPLCGKTGLKGFVTRICLDVFADCTVVHQRSVCHRRKRKNEVIWYLVCDRAEILVHVVTDAFRRWNADCACRQSLTREHTGIGFRCCT